MAHFTKKHRFTKIIRDFIYGIHQGSLLQHKRAKLDLDCSPELFNPFPNKPWFLHVCSTSLLKTLREKEKLLVMSNFSFSHSVFYPFGQLSAILIKLKIVVCKLFQFGVVQNLSLGKG